MTTTKITPKIRTLDLRLKLNFPFKPPSEDAPTIEFMQGQISRHLPKPEDVKIAEASLAKRRKIEDNRLIA